MNATRRLGWRGKLLLSVLSPIVAFGLLEIGLRFGGFRYEPWRANLEGRTYDQLRQREVFTPHPDLLWTLRPSSILDLPSCGFPGVVTNSVGLRGKELPGPKSPGDFRVLCMGDSVTFGLGLEDGETWPDRMEEELGDAPELAGRNVVVLNAGVPGWSSVQGMRNLDRLAEFEPDAVVFWCGLPDANDMFDLPDSAQRMPVEGVPRAMAGLWKLRVFQLVQKVVIGARQRATEGTRVGRAEYRANVERLLSREQEAGGPKVVFVHEPERCDAAIAQLRAVVVRAEEAGAEFVLGPQRLLSWIIPVPDGYPLTGRKTTHRGRPAIVFPRDSRFLGCERVDGESDTARLREDLDRLTRLKMNLDRILEGLPEGALTYEDLFGRASPEKVFMDNCHLTPYGARRAGEVLARRVLGRPRDGR